MAGIVYLFICLAVGWELVLRFGGNSSCRTDTAFSGKIIKGGGQPIPEWFVRLPVSFLAGTLAVTWAVYLAALCFQKLSWPILIADIVVMGAAVVLLLLRYCVRRKRRPSEKAFGKNIVQRILKVGKASADGKTSPDRRISAGDAIFLVLILLLAGILMGWTFFVKDGVLYTGYSVFSDFSPHIGMIQSFAKDGNIPTQYSFYAGEDIRYHFMYQFLVGNLTLLGLRIDWAFNLVSVLGFTGACMLLYVLAARITERKVCGYLAVLFFLFRSSGAMFDFLASVPSGTGILEALRTNTEFIGETPNESWGLWNLNVYCNQRHLAFGMIGLLYLLLAFLPGVYRAAGSIGTKTASASGGTGTVFGSFKTLFFTPEGWHVHCFGPAVFAGLLLGGLAFWNGAVVVAALLVLFGIAVVSDRRLELLIMAAIAAALTLLQSALFVDGETVSMAFRFGFLAENKTLFGAAEYLGKLLGLLPFVIAAAFLLGNTVNRRLIGASLLPLLFAFTISLTPDIAVNHKYIMISVMLLGIFAAEFTVRMFESRAFGGFLLKAAAVLLTICLTATGIYDFRTILKKNGPNRSIQLSLTDPLSTWIFEHADSDDIFLTPQYALNRVVYGGAMLYNGWPYFAWSAGYDTNYRAAQVKAMYEADSTETLKLLVEQNQIRYIIVDRDARTSTDYTVREDIIAAAFRPVYEEGEGEWKLTIYDTLLCAGES